MFTMVHMLNEINIMQSKEELQKRIRFLQRTLIQMSFGSRQKRPELYTSVMNSLHIAQKSLIKNKQQN